jgi:hypothetical protein
VPSGVYKREYSERRLRPVFTSRPHRATPKATGSPSVRDLGRVSYVRYNNHAITKVPGLWNWSVYGQRARGVIYTLFPFMSIRRRGQMKIALGLGG